MYENDFRRAKTLLHITDQAGNAVANETFSIEQTSHEFLFGCGAFDAIPAANDKKGDPFYEDRMNKWTDLYNFGTMAFYWGGYEEQEGEPAFESRMNASRYLVERGKKVKGHPLCWHTWCADWLMEYDNATILDKQLKRIRREVSAFAGVLTVDNRKKPSYEMLMNLIHKEWHTSLTVHTDENGFAEMTGYKGVYALSGASGSGSFRLTKAQDATEVQCTTGA